MKDQIKTLAKKSEEAKDPNDAMKFAQAALNLAHTASVQRETEDTEMTCDETTKWETTEKDTTETERTIHEKDGRIIPRGLIW